MMLAGVEADHRPGLAASAAFAGGSPLPVEIPASLTITSEPAAPPCPAVAVPPVPLVALPPAPPFDVPPVPLALLPPVPPAVPDEEASLMLVTSPLAPVDSWSSCAGAASAHAHAHAARKHITQGRPSRALFIVLTTLPEIRAHRCLLYRLFV